MRSFQKISIIFFSLFLFFPFIGIKAYECGCKSTGSDECIAVETETDDCNFECSIAYDETCDLVPAEEDYEIPAYGCGCLEIESQGCIPVTATDADDCLNKCSSDDIYENVCDLGSADSTPDTDSTPVDTRDDSSSSTSSDGYDVKLTPGTASTTFEKPILGINIPTISFSEALVKNGFLEINWLGEYIGGLYLFLLSIGGIFAVLLIMVGGVQYVISRGSGEVSEAKKRITNAVTGLVLLFCVFIILYIINPKLTSFGGLKLQTIQPIEFSFYAENLASCPEVANTIKACSAKTFVNPGTWPKPGSWNPDLVAMINEYGIKYQIDPLLLAVHLQKESGGRDAATFGRTRGPCGEFGLPQFMPITFDNNVHLSSKCCTNVSRKHPAASDANSCTKTTPWPPPVSEIPKCDTKNCGNCQEVTAACIDYLSNSATGLRNSVDSQAKFVKNTLRSKGVNGDLALEMCAYNGSGLAAAKYATDGKVIYKKLCESSGGSQ